MNKKQNYTLVVIPVRNRNEESVILLKAIKKHLKRPFKIVFVTQTPGLPFNRGALLNAGVVEYIKLCQAQRTCQPNEFIFHDVDTIPENDNAYEPPASLGTVQHYFGYAASLGGVWSITNDDLFCIGGHPLHFWGWGAEDVFIKRRVDHYKINTSYPHGKPKLDTSRSPLTGNNHFIRLPTEESIKTYNELNRRKAMSLLVTQGGTLAETTACIDSKYCSPKNLMAYTDNCEFVDVSFNHAPSFVNIAIVSDKLSFLKHKLAFTGWRFFNQKQALECKKSFKKWVYCFGANMERSSFTSGKIDKVFNMYELQFGDKKIRSSVIEDLVPFITDNRNYCIQYCNKNKLTVSTTGALCCILFLVIVVCFFIILM